MESIKKFFIDLYCRKGPALGKFLLINMGITAAGFLIIFCTGSGMTFQGFLEILIATPMVSIMVTVARAVVSLFHVIVPMQRGLVKTVVDFFAVLLMLSGIGYFMSDMPMPESNFLQYVITIVLDVIYVAVTVALLAANKLVSAEPVENIE